MILCDPPTASCRFDPNVHHPQVPNWNPTLLANHLGYSVVHHLGLVFTGAEPHGPCLGPPGGLPIHVKGSGPGPESSLAPGVPNCAVEWVGSQERHPPSARTGGRAEGGGWFRMAVPDGGSRVRGWVQSSSSSASNKELYSGLATQPTGKNNIKK